MLCSGAQPRSRYRPHRLHAGPGRAVSSSQSEVVSAVCSRARTSAASLWVGGAFAWSLSLATLWIRFTAQPTGVSALTESKRLIALLLPVALLLWSARLWLRDPAITVRVRLGLWTGHLQSAVLVSIGALQRISVAATTTPEHHLRLVWTGLDVIELLGLLNTAWFLTIGSRRVCRLFHGGLLGVRCLDQRHHNGGGAARSKRGGGSRAVPRHALLLGRRNIWLSGWRRRPVSNRWSERCPFSPVGRLHLEGGVSGTEPSGVDGSNARPVHGLNLISGLASITTSVSFRFQEFCQQGLGAPVDLVHDVTDLLYG